MIKSKDAKKNQLPAGKIPRSTFLKLGGALASGSCIAACSPGASKNNSVTSYYNRADSIVNPSMMAPAIPPESKRVAADPAKVPPPVKYAKPKFHNVNIFCKEILKEGVLGALPEKLTQLIAVAVAHVTQCPYYIRSHPRQAIRKGASKQALMEAVWIAAEISAGAATAHVAIDKMNNLEKQIE